MKKIFLIDESLDSIICIEIKEKEINRYSLRARLNPHSNLYLFQEEKSINNEEAVKFLFESLSKERRNEIFLKI